MNKTNPIEQFNKTCDVAMCSLKLRDKTNATTIKMINELKTLANQVFKELKVGFVDRNKNHAYFTQHVGSGSGKTDDGREVEFECLTAAKTSSPIIRYKHNYYILTWNDILNLAEYVGLFDEETDK